MSADAPSPGKAWFVLITVRGGYNVHSVHATEEAARSWAKCKEHDGHDTAVASMDATALHEASDDLKGS